MLNLESRTEVLGITVFQDTDHPNQFYYLPGPPHITQEHGEPLFDLYTYRKGGAAGTTLTGGFLNMAVDLGIGALKDRIVSQLQQRYGDAVTLAPVPFTRGAVRVLALGEDSQATHGGAENETTASGDPLVSKGPRFIQTILGAGRPSLDGDNRAIFSFSLNEDGAAFFLGILSGKVNARPVGVVYELDYVGLLPAYDLEISLDFRSIYDYTRTRFTLGTLFFKADVDNIVEELRRREFIKIKETARTLELSTAEAVRERQNRIDQLVKELASGALFQPSLIPGEPRARGETITAHDPAALIPVAPGQSLTQAALRYGPSAALMVGQAEAHGRAANPEGAPRPSSPPTGTPTGPGTPTGGETGAPTTQTTAADLWNRLGRPQAAFVLKTMRQEEQRTVTYHLNQVTAQQQSIAPQNLIQFLANPRDLNRHVHVVDLNHPFFQRLNININALDVDFAAQGITQMVVQLRYGVRPDGTGPKDTAEALLRKQEDSLDMVFFMDQHLTQSYEYKLSVDYRSDFGMGVKTPRVESDWIRTEARSLAVHPSWLSRTLPITVQLEPDPPDDLLEAQVHVHYANAAHGIDDTLLVQLAPDKRSQQLCIRLADANEAYDVTTMLFYQDGTHETLPTRNYPDPTAGQADQVVVINAPRANRINGDVLMRDPLGELETVLVDMKMQQGNNLLESRAFELNQSKGREVWSVRLTAPTPTPVLTYRERRLYLDGGLEEFEWRQSPSPNIVVGMPAEGVLAVSIQYLGPQLASVGLDAILLDLSYSDPGGDLRFTQNKAVLITDDGNTHRQEWKIRLVDKLATTYRWKMTLLFSDGSENSTEVNSDQRALLVIRLPSL